jgi:hypothetical protein
MKTIILEGNAKLMRYKSSEFDLFVLCTEEGRTKGLFTGVALNSIGGNIAGEYSKEWVKEVFEVVNERVVIINDLNKEEIDFNKM